MHRQQPRAKRLAVNDDLTAAAHRVAQLGVTRLKQQHQLVRISGGEQLQLEALVAAVAGGHRTIPGHRRPARRTSTPPPTMPHRALLSAPHRSACYEWLASGAHDPGQADGPGFADSPPDPPTRRRGDIKRDHAQQKRPVIPPERHCIADVRPTLSGMPNRAGDPPASALAAGWLMFAGFFIGGIVAAVYASDRGSAFLLALAVVISVCGVVGLVSAAIYRRR